MDAKTFYLSMECDWLPVQTVESNGFYDGEQGDDEGDKASEE